MNDKLVGAGFDLSELDKLVHEHGEEVLKLIEDAMDNGLSKATVTEVLMLGGKLLLEIMADLMSLNKAQLADPNFGLTQGEDVGRLIFNPKPADPNAPPAPPNRPLINLLSVLAQKILPLVLQKFVNSGGIITLINMVIKLLVPPTPAPSK